MYVARPELPAAETGFLARLQRFLTPGDPRQAVQTMANPVGAVMPGMVSESRLVPILLKILREKGLGVKQAEQVAVDAVTSGKIGPDQFKMVIDALRKVGQRGAAQKVFAPVEKTFSSAASSLAPAGVEGTRPLGSAAIGQAARLLKRKFEGGF